MFELGRWCVESLGEPNAVQVEVLNHIVYDINNTFCFYYSNCELCGFNDFVSLFNSDRWGVPCKSVYCKNCGLIQINPRLNSSSYNLFYNKYYNKLSLGKCNNELNYLDIFNGQLHKADEVFREILRVRTVIDTNCSILDIGCSLGGLIKRFNNGGLKNCVGIDINSDFVKYGRENFGVNIRESSIFDLNSKYDIIISNHVLEHIDNPKEHIKYIFDNLLSDNGLFFVSVPSINSIFKVNAIFPLEASLHFCHPFLYSVHTLTRLFCSCGYVPILLKENPTEGIFSIFCKENWEVNSLENKLKFHRLLSTSK